MDEIACEEEDGNGELYVIRGLADGRRLHGSRVSSGIWTEREIKLGERSMDSGVSEGCPAQDQQK
jgi:hypothetical protein